MLEAARRLRSCVPGATLPLPRLMLCENLPFTPIYDAWQTRLRSLGSRRTEDFRETISQVYADELTNWSSPYEIRGGVYDSLIESRGNVLIANNVSVRMAMNTSLDVEGIDVEPAVGVAVACLRDAVTRGKSARIPSCC